MTTNVNDKIEGVVIVWKQGYGFAKRSNTGEDVFIHRSVLPPGVQALHAGDKSEVHPDIGQEGASAASVETRTRLILSSAFGHNIQRERIPKPSSMRGVIPRWAE